MTSTPPAEPLRVAVIGTGLIGASVALAAARAGAVVSGWDPDPTHVERAAAQGALVPAGSVEDAVADADVVVVAAPIEAIPGAVVAALRGAARAVVTDAGSIKGPVVAEVQARAAHEGVPLDRYVPSHPMGGSERSGPDRASASVLDGIVWAVTPTPSSSDEAVASLDAFIRGVGAEPAHLTPERHDRLVAFVSHLPQVASTALMSLAVSEEAGEPDILLLAAGGFRDLTRLAASSPQLWGQILLANGEEVCRAIELYSDRLLRLRDDIRAGAVSEVEATFSHAKAARVRLAAKPQVRAGVAVLQVPIPDRPGSLAQLTGGLARGGVNIEDLQIVHSLEGGRGQVHLTVAAASVDAAVETLAADGFDPVRLA